MQWQFVNDNYAKYYKSKYFQFYYSAFRKMPLAIILKQTFINKWSNFYLL